MPSSRHPITLTLRLFSSLRKAKTPSPRVGKGVNSFPSSRSQYSLSYLDFDGRRKRRTAPVTIMRPPAIAARVIEPGSGTAARATEVAVFSVKMSVYA